jgi:hypothetical protein
VICATRVHSPSNWLIQPIPVQVVVEEQLIDEALSATASMHDHVFEFFQLVQMTFHLRIAPSGRHPHIATAETKILTRHIEPFAFALHHLIDQQQQAPRLWRQIINGPPHHFIDQRPRYAHIVRGGLDVFDRAALALHRLHRPLMLMKQRHRADQPQ